MDRYVMRQPQIGGVALIPESSMPLHKGLGWVRVSDAIAEEAMHGVDLAAYVEAVDLDATEPNAEPADDAAPEAPKTTTRSKEK